jgi:hypothetical protein
MLVALLRKFAVINIMDLLISDDKFELPCKSAWLRSVRLDALNVIKLNKGIESRSFRRIRLASVWRRQSNKTWIVVSDLKPQRHNGESVPNIDTDWDKRSIVTSRPMRRCYKGWSSSQIVINFVAMKASMNIGGKYWFVFPLMTLCKRVAHSNFTLSAKGCQPSSLRILSLLVFLKAPVIWISAWYWMFSSWFASSEPSSKNITQPYSQDWANPTTMDSW